MPRFTNMAGAVTMVVSASIAVPILGPEVLAQGQRPPFQRLEQRAGVIEGTLTRVDGGTETVDVSIGPFRLLGRTIAVGPETRIEVDGREARFADLREGARVKAFYEERGARLIATRLEVSTGDGGRG
jgi:hypothetical protein